MSVEQLGPVDDGNLYPMVPVEEVKILQDVAMGHLRHRYKTKRAYRIEEHFEPAIQKRFTNAMVQVPSEGSRNRAGTDL
ncbi:MAG TPA: hypothetical protein VK983_05135 [Candidatus Limnocylindrales bacterium]|nr:hypothetical protein [Candidatus Limnocylindrales bacterium]